MIRNAANKWVRALLTSARRSTYLVRYLNHIEMREAVREKWGDDIPGRRE